MEIISKEITENKIQEEPVDLESRLKYRRNILRKSCGEQRLTGGFKYLVENKLFT